MFPRALGSQGSTVHTRGPPPHGAHAWPQLLVGGASVLLTHRLPWLLLTQNKRSGEAHPDSRQLSGQSRQGQGGNGPCVWRRH